jgi:hypothetical protein
MAVEVIAQVGDRAPRCEPGCPLRQPPRAGGQFAVMFGVTILRRDERGGQGQHGRLARRDQRRGDGEMDMAGLTVGQGARGTVGTGNGVRGEVLRPIQRDRETAGEGTVGLQCAQSVEAVHDVHQQRRQFLRGDRVEQVAVLLVAGNFMPPEQRRSIVTPALLLHPHRVIEERRTRGEKTRQRH